jgi:hypothetical protein
MKQTAVEWLLNNLLSEPWAEEHFKHNAECWDKAKEMEKEQIVEAFFQGVDRESDGHGAMYLCRKDAEQYYNQTFKQQEQ